MSVFLTLSSLGTHKTCQRNAQLKALTKMKRLLQCCGSVAATLQQLDMYATTGGDKVANLSG